MKLRALAILSMLLLAGCSSGQAGKSSSTNLDDKIRIEYWHVNAETQGGLSVETLVNEFNAQSDTIEVVPKYNADMYSGLLRNFQAEVAAGNTPAIVQVGWAFLEYFGNNFAYVMPQDIISDYFPEDESYLEDNFLANILELAQNSDGSQLGLPYSLSTPVLYLNLDLLESAGLDTAGPSTWIEVQEYAEIIKQETGKYGLYIQEPADNWATQALLESNGARLITDGLASFASEEGIEAYSLYADMVNDNLALHISWDEGVSAFNAGEIGMLYTTIARSASILASIDFNIATVPSPEWDNQEKRIPAGGAFLAITATTPETQQAAWEFQKFLYEVDSVVEWSLGTGYVPPTKAFEGDALNPILEQNPLMQPAVQQMYAVVPWTSFPGDSGLEAEQILLDVRDQILGGSVSASDGLTAAQHKINAILGN
ncbi:MAG: glycerol-3-phosphate ABC transporter substrate-binding protein [Epulopiscium sp. Nele67-Bin002]|nr:MAG: glycerol-3-phosphate ABC transporter substrate-binding protein [Epulopiscium sp. Nele67-Bin002]OON92150.1 MAG: glycerol-3-phosphate ABC transporter substrate-binding protein [Epulopiscium sp. Nele67-Bin001]